MAGHNRWSKVKHRKKVVDSRRSKVWSKCAKAIMVAAKHGGADPEANLALRYAIDEARYANMPRDTIERAAKKGAGELGAVNYETLRYEGYAPGGVAVVIEALTDNRTRTAADVRSTFIKYGGNLGASGCVGFLFQSRGQIAIAPEGVSGDRLMEVAIEAGAQDVDEPADDESPWVVACEPLDFLRVKDAIEKAGFTVQDAAITLIPGNTVRVTGEDAKLTLRIIDTLEDHDDIQKVYANYEMSEEELAALQG